MQNPSASSEAPKYIIPSEMAPPLNTHLVTDEQGLREVEAFLERTSVYGFDLETNVTDTFFDRVVRTIQFGDKQEQYVIDLLAFAGEAGLAAEQAHFGSRLSPGLLRVKQVIQRHLEDPTRTKVGQGLQFESEMMWWNFGIRAQGYYDTLLAEKNIWAGLVHFMAKGFWGLEDLVLKYTGLTMSKDEQKNFDLTTPLTQKQIDYTGLDVRLPMAVRNGQLRIIEKDELMRACQIDFDAIPAFADMHIAGIFLDADPWEEIIDDRMAMRALVIEAMDKKLIPVVGSKIITQEEIDRRDAIETAWCMCPNKTVEERAQRAALRKQYMLLRKNIADRTKDSKDFIGQAAINYSSPQQIRDAFWDLGFSKKQFPKTDDRILERLAKFPALTIEKAFKTDGLDGDMLTNKHVAFLATLPIVDLLRLFRSIEKSITTYGQTWILTMNEVYGKKKKRGIVNPFTGRIHSDISQFGAATGRTSSSDPNIQNIPKGSKYRHCFRARPGYKLITVDYSGCELRILAELSGEKVWLDAFKNGWDVHSVGAEIVFGKRWAEGAIEGCKYVSDHQKCKCPIHEDLRNKVKAINFGLCIAKGQRVLTDCGLVPIECVTTSMKVWDGVEFVAHGGLLHKGKKRVITYDGLTATPDHKVWLDSGRTVSLGQAASALDRPRLAATGIEETPIRFLADCLDRDSQGQEVGQGGLDGVRPLPAKVRSLGPEHSEWGDQKLSTLQEKEIHRSASNGSWGTIRRYGAALLKPVLAVMEELWRKGNRESLQVSPALHRVPAQALPGCTELRRIGNRQDEQRWSLRGRQPETCAEVGEPAESQEEVEVYDLYNAGPRHRFTCEGKLVSNCYGMMAKKLGDELGIPEAEAQALLDIYYASFPTIISYLQKSGDSAKTNFSQRTICGRRRRWQKPSWEAAKRLVLLDVAAELKKPVEDQDKRKLVCNDRAISWKLRTLTGNIEREGKNSPIQGANADVVKMAMAMIWRELFPRFGAFFVNMVHDELVIECPEECADECRKFVCDTMELAGTLMLKLIPMTVEWNIDDYWSK